MSEHQLKIETEIGGQLGEYQVEYMITGFEVEVIEVRDSDGEVVDPSFAEDMQVRAKIMVANFRGELT